MESKQPINLNLLTMKYPLPAIVSILHRLSGVLLFLLLPVILSLFQYSLASYQHFVLIKKASHQGFWMPLLFWIIIVSVLYHLLAGVRHLLMDIGLGADMDTTKKSAWLVLIITMLLALFVGIWLW